ncbi:MAG TPA: cytochrome c3 family protein [Anaerohalosphaeraceae bacterium]|nr:cytochrome c3 family protein [Anaerohalosphaeraceae bacterium]HOL89579.1 cytochrome c3 family protein [Anaerohalosphaeraceae bacterium]HPP55575.1 cytochrome c3 family protein [Anaerohalosphaeraceae bacterium]
MKSDKQIILIWLAVATVGAVLAAEQGELLGDGNDANRSPYVHWIDLLDEKGVKIRPQDNPARPFSTRKTCGQCHDYQTIAGGWHFPGPQPKDAPGRPGQPWVLRDVRTRTQIPISPRGWKGAFPPEQVGLSGWDYLNEFGTHLPGGGYGELPADPQNPRLVTRQEISGKYEINCLACHNRDNRQDLNTAALQAARQNYRWIAAASSGLAVVNGTASALSDFFDPEFDEGITTHYREGIFNKEGQVFFDISRICPPERCYFCHSNQNLKLGESDIWTEDEDVHLKSGLSCTDCHRHGRDHKINRGYEMSDPRLASLTCEGCHLGTSAVEPDAGRLGAPKPLHRGIPTIHFEKLTCTACHTSLWPQQEIAQWRTARMHKIGLHGKHSMDLRLPKVYGPVFLKGHDGKIGPHRLFWPAYWGLLEGDSVLPLPPAEVLKAAGSILAADAERVNDWRVLTEEQIAEVLRRLTPSDSAKQPVYICGGRLYCLEADALVSTDHPAAEPYAWPIAHDVRPSKQALGTLGCADCHTTDSPFFFAPVPADSPIAGMERFVPMVQLQGLSRLYVWAFNFSFVFRPWMKAVCLCACGLVGLVLLAYAVKAAAVLSEKAVEEPK